MHFDHVALAYNSQTVNLANAILLSLDFRVILNIALQCPVLSVLSVLPRPLVNSAALPSPVRNVYVLTIPCAIHNCLPCTALRDLYDINSK